jgi:predicted nuclease of predicted toxin-antitoxin system
MKLLLDQDVYGLTVKFLIEAGYELLTVAQLDMSQASDEEVLKTAQAQNRILITRDRDYGNRSNITLPIDDRKSIIQPENRTPLIACQEKNR